MFNQCPVEFFTTSVNATHLSQRILKSLSADDLLCLSVASLAASNSCHQELERRRENVLERLVRKSTEF